LPFSPRKGEGFRGNAIFVAGQRAFRGNRKGKNANAPKITDPILEGVKISREYLAY